MTREHANPFDLPGLGQSGEFAGNPIMASMEMMRQAWQSLAGQGGLGAPSMAPPLSVEDLERRITDLRAVENWLRMNLTVLSNTIQGLEVQRATLSTLKSFVHNASAAAGRDATALESLFGFKPIQPTPEPARAQDAPQQSSSTAQQTKQTKAVGADAAQRAAPPLLDADQAIAATQAWWDMLRQQFDSLAAATAASMSSNSSGASGTSAAGASTAGAAAGPAASSGAPRKTAAAKPKARRSSTMPKSATSRKSTTASKPL